MAAINHSSSDYQIFAAVLGADEHYLKWLGSKSREEMWDILDDVKTLMLSVRMLGPIGALEILYQMERYLNKKTKGCVPTHTGGKNGKKGN